MHPRGNKGLLSNDTERLSNSSVWNVSTIFGADSVIALLALSQRCRAAGWHLRAAQSLGDMSTITPLVHYRVALYYQDVRGAGANFQT